MAETLYNRDILRLAAQLEHKTLSVSSDHYISSAEKNAPICGSKASVQIAVDHDRHIIDAAFTVNSCAMGQASTAILMEYMHGKNQDDILSMRTALHNRLNSMASDVSAWPKLSILDVANGYSARHGAILLPYDTILLALENCELGREQRG